MKVDNVSFPGLCPPVTSWFVGEGEGKGQEMRDIERSDTIKVTIMFRGKGSVLENSPRERQRENGYCFEWSYFEYLSNTRVVMGL